ncbi:MAG: response regulator [Thermodesulfobacteriota bacterium]
MSGKSASPESIPAVPKHAIVVVDDRNVFDALSGVLRSLDFRVDHALELREAAERVRGADVPVALIGGRSVRCEGPGGVDLLKEARPGIACVSVTWGGEEDPAAASPGGWAYDRIRMPADAMALLPVLDRCMERVRLQRERDRAAEELRRRNEEMERLDARLKAMVDSARTFAACQEFRKLSRLLLERVAFLMAAEGGSLFLCQEQGLELAATLDPGMAPTVLPFPLREGSVFDYAYRERRPVLAEDIRQAPDFSLSGRDMYRDDSFIVFPLIDEARNVVGLLSLHNKITPPFTHQDLELGQIMVSLGSETLQKQMAAEALRQNQEHLARLATAVEQADEDVIITDNSGTIVYVNPSFTRITGYFPEEAVGRTPKLLSSGKHDEAFYREMWDTLRKGSTWKGRLTNRRKDGALILQACSITPFRDPSGSVSGYVSVNRDITREVQVEARIAQTQKLEAIGTLAGGIAHDFNNILMAILGYSGLALAQVPPDSPLREKLQSIYVAGNRASELTRQILAFSRPTLQVRRIVRVKPIASEVMKLMRASLPSTIEIRESFLSEASVLAEPAQIHQVLMNLCTNAGLAMRSAGGVLEVGLADVDLDAALLAPYPGAVPGRYIAMTVRDTGVGMDPGILDRIFDPFFTTRPTGEGSGMGLSVVHGIVRTHGGFVTVRSEPGNGSEFSVYLPAVEEAAPPAPESDRAVPRGTERILFVDDEKVLVDMVKEMLEGLGYRVTAVADSREALGMFLSAPEDYDIVITDITMPGVTGDALVRLFLQKRPDLPIVICTGYSERLSEAEAKRIGARAFLYKPFSMSAIAGLVRSILDGRASC